MNTPVTIGLTRFSDMKLSLKNSYLDNSYRNTLYFLTLNNKNVVVVFDQYLGYFELFQSLFETNNRIEENELIRQFYNNPNFILDLLHNNMLGFLFSSFDFENNDFSSENLKRNQIHSDLFYNEIKNNAGRAASSWFHYLYLSCFFSYQEGATLKIHGFQIETNKVEFLRATNKTIKANLDKLKSIEVIDFKYSSETISNLRFNINNFPILKEFIPSLFTNGFYSNNEQS